MKKGILYYSILFCTAAMFAAGCTESGHPAGMEEDTAVTFCLTRAAGIGEGRLARLYIGERKPEHSSEALHCNSFHDFSGATVQVSGLLPQWYKFVFLSVPEIAGVGDDVFTEEIPGDGTCDMNKLMIDYMPVLEQSAGTEFPVAALSDGDIFRKVINRWMESDEISEENVEMTRLNGQLEIDMGILEDQFDGSVEKIVLEIADTPTRIYITDNDCGEIKTTGLETVSWTTRPYHNVTGANQDPVSHHKISVNLLPGALTGSITVRMTGGEDYVYPLVGDNGASLSIKANTRTKLEFNGLRDGYFTVRYAGYADAGIDVDDDAWDGWKTNNEI